MGADYEKWLAENLAKETESDYVEPGVQELVAMMDAMPYPSIDGNE